jgi:hypothetical protein
MARTLKVEIVGDSSSPERALGRAQTQTSSFGKSLNKASLYAAGAFVGSERVSRCGSRSASSKRAG